MDGTPIYDIKPYIVYADSHAEARSGFVDYRKWKRLEVVIPDDVAAHLQQQGLNRKGQETLKEVLAQDPRPHYQHDADKVYGMKYDGLDIHFRVDGNTLTVQK
jgi:tRNA (adenine37-N6)-methyltransferase